jgi:hypothetical protein
MKIETIKKDPQIVAMSKERYGKWKSLLTDLAFDKMLIITDDKPKRIQLNIIGSFRQGRKHRKGLNFINFTLHTLIRDKRLYVWKEPMEQ